MSKLKPCPVCGRKPRLRVKSHFLGCLVRLRCKPLLGRSHLICTVLADCKENAFLRAIEVWNEKVDRYGS